MAIIKKYSAKVVKIYNRCPRVYSLDLVSLGKPFKFNAGQFLHLALDEYDPSENWPQSRCFSIQSPPGSKIIKLTYSVIGEFTTRMETEMETGSEVTLKLPYGELFTQKHNKNNTVFISGGTGITPFLSLFNDPSFKDYSNPLLYAGFRNHNVNFYNNELDLARKFNPGLRIMTCYQDIEGYLNIELILYKSQSDTSFFISGPPDMIRTFKEYLIKNGISANQIFTDDWK